MERLRRLYAVMAFFSVAGLVSSFWQLLDKLDLLAHPASNLSCNLNSVFNCSRILTSHQYEILGFPNAMIGMVMFTAFLVYAITGLTGSKFARKVALSIQFLAIFMLGFIVWFVFESIYRIGALCLFCTIIGPSVLVINGVLLRVNQPILPGSYKIKQFIERGGDLFLWSLILIVAVFAAFMKFM